MEDRKSARLILKKLLLIWVMIGLAALIGMLHRVGLGLAEEDPIARGEPVRLAALKNSAANRIDSKNKTGETSRWEKNI